MDASAFLAAADLVALIHESALDRGKADPMLRALSVALRADAAQWQVRANPQWTVCESRTVLHDSSVPDFDGEYLQRWGRSDPLAAPLRQRPWRDVERWEPPQVPGIRDHRLLHQQFLLRHDLGSAIAGAFPQPQRRAGVVTLYRRPGAAPFDTADEDLFRHLLSQFERAGNSAARVEQQSSELGLAADALQQLPVPCVLTDRAGRCLQSNDCFRTLPQPLPFHVVMGRLRFRHAASQSRWEDELQAVHTTGVTRLVESLGNESAAWGVELQPLVSHRSAPGSNVILALFKPAPTAPAANPQLLQARSKLTRAELEVLAGLLKGMRAKTIADYRGASVHTVRSQIMTILGKTGYSSQKELIASFAVSHFSDSTLARISDIPPGEP